MDPHDSPLRSPISSPRSPFLLLVGKSADVGQMLSVVAYGALRIEGPQANPYTRIPKLQALIPKILA